MNVRARALSSFALAAAAFLATPVIGHAQTIPGEVPGEVPIGDREPSTEQIWLRGRIFNPNGTTFVRLNYQEQLSPWTGQLSQSLRVEIQRGGAPNTEYTLFAEGVYVCTVKTDSEGRASRYVNNVPLLRAGDTVTMNGLSGTLESSI